jgi:hypothetical protein
MTTQEYDTDPSTPGAKRLSDPRGGDSEVGQDAELSGSRLAPEVPSRARHNTDPGIAPPPEPLPVPVEAMGVVVPPVARMANDTVDALLDGIRREQPQSRGTPQTDGQIAASYHSEHGLRAAQAAVREEPKVVIERPVLAQTVRIRMSGSKVSVLPYGNEATDATAVNARPMFGRMVIAVLGGVAVVLLIFGALQRISAQVTPVQASALSPPVPPPAAARPIDSAATDTPAVASDTETIAPGRVATESQPTTASSAMASAAVASTAPRKPATPAKSTKPKAKPTPSATKPASDDLGEFKAAF